MLSDIRDRLESIGEELADVALDRLRAATEGDPDAAAEEKRITRARRAVEKAVHFLDGAPSADD